ncbi:uncharacterized protein LOC144453770 [Glandiceps talaboti]
MFAGAPEQNGYKGTDCLAALPKCTPLAECFSNICASGCDEPGYAAYCRYKDFVEYILDHGIPDIGLPLGSTVTLLATVYARPSVEWCGGGYSIKCDEHPDGCVWFEDVCPNAGYKDCYCDLGFIAKRIDFLKALVGSLDGAD